MRRRRLILRAAGLPLALPLLARPAAARAQGAGDRELIVRAITLELELLAAYGSARGFAAAERFRGHTAKHVRGLSELLRNRGGRPPARASAEGPHDPATLLGLENDAVAFLHRAHAELDDATLLPVFASVMANHGQHLVVLRQALGRDPLPDAFERGVA